MIKHIKPDWYFYADRYNKGWASLTKCNKCGTIGMYEDCHPVSPCSLCGGKREEGLVGKWIKPTYKFWIFGKIKDGYWKIRNEKT